MAVAFWAVYAELVQPQRGKARNQRFGVWKLRVPTNGHGQQQPVEHMHGKGWSGSDRRQRDRRHRQRNCRYVAGAYSAVRRESVAVV